MDHRSMREVFLRHVGQTTPLALGLEVAKAEGVFIHGTDGKKYYDLNSGISVSSLGHRHPRILEALRGQLDRYLHTMVYGEHIQSPQVEFAKLLCDQLDPRLNSVFYLNSGSEVIEAGMKLLKRATGRYEIIACRNAYHGSTQGAESLRSDYRYAEAFRPLIPGIRHIEFNNTTDLEKIGCRTAGVIVEPVQAEAGVIPPRGDYLKKLRQRCDETQSLLMFDEIQTGFGRTGKLFAYQKYDVLPDILALGKAMGGGLPTGALVSSRALMKLFTHDPDLGHITTFGGHPLPCTSAKAALELLLEGDIPAHVLEMESFIHKKLQHAIIREVRSSGLLMAVELTRRKYLKHVVAKAFELGALVDYFLFNNTSFRLAPPLIYTMEEMDRACDILLEACNFAESQYN